MNKQQLKMYKTIYNELKNKKVFGIYDEDRLTITTINNQTYIVNLNCLMFYGQVLVDDNDTMIPFNQLTEQSITDIINYMYKKMEGN